MKATFVTALAALAAHLVNAHYTFPDLIIGTTITADWEYIRETDNHYSNAPVTDVTSPSMKCYESTTAAQTSTATVAAGSTVGFQANGPIYHNGYLDVYLSAANPASDEDAGSGTTWFKIWEDPPVYTGGELVFPSTTMQSFTLTLPAELPSGQYLMRVEQIALHVASSFGAAQFYLACAQINVTGGGSGTPGPFAAFPGAYTGYEPGILIDIYNLPANFTGYQSPGPAVWPGTGGSSPPSTSVTPHSSSTAKSSSTSSGKTSTTSVKTSSTTSVKTSTSSSAKTSSSSAPVGGTVAHYGQCGGSSYTGPTVCASPYTCTVSSQYYSQCL